MEKEQLALMEKQNTNLAENKQGWIDLHNELDETNRIHAHEVEAEIDVIHNTAALKIGERLLELKSIYQHGQWGKWLQYNPWGYSERKAQRLMHWALAFKSATVADLNMFEVKALDNLTDKYTPKPALEEAIERSSQGEFITSEKAKEITDRYKAEAEAAKQELERERASRKLAIQQVVTPLEDRLASLESKRSSLTKERDFLLESKNKDGACIINQNQIIDQLRIQVAEPQVITQEVQVEVEKIVEVIPEDYEQFKKEINVLKKTLEDLKQESCEELSQHQTKVRKLTIELTKKEKLLESSSNDEQKQLKGIQKINEGMKCIEEACSLLGNRCENIFHPQLKEVIESSLQSLILFLNNFFCNDKNGK